MFTLALDKLGADEVERILGTEDQPAKAGEWLECRACGNRITRPSAALEVQGAHRHTFTNPHGIEFRIVVCGDAVGCGLAGSATAQWTWFAGYRWRIASCHRCRIHLGWGFCTTSAGREPAGFYGLIEDRLR